MSTTQFALILIHRLTKHCTCILSPKVKPTGILINGGSLLEDTSITVKDLVGFYFSPKGLTQNLNVPNFFPKFKKKEMFSSLSRHCLSSFSVAVIKQK